MPRRTPELTAAIILAVATLIAVIVYFGTRGDGADKSALPDVTVSQSQQADPEVAGPNGPTAIGLLTSVTRDRIVLKMPDGTSREFLVRPQDTETVGLSHLASHAGFPDIGFLVQYETVAGKDYLLRATETLPPK